MPAAGGPQVAAHRLGRPAGPLAEPATGQRRRLRRDAAGTAGPGGRPQAPFHQEDQVEVADHSHAETADRAARAFELSPALAERCPVPKQRGGAICLENAASRSGRSSPLLRRTGLCSDLTLSDATLRYEMPCSRGSGPFDVLVEGLSPPVSRDDRIRTCDLLTPSQTRYQAALHPVGGRGVAGRPRTSDTNGSRGFAAVPVRGGQIRRDRGPTPRVRGAHPAALTRRRGARRSGRCGRTGCRRSRRGWRCSGRLRGRGS